jgi:hypothetical protein
VAILTHNNRGMIVWDNIFIEAKAFPGVGVIAEGVIKVEKYHSIPQKVTAIDILIHPQIGPPQLHPRRYSFYYSGTTSEVLSI